MNEKRKEGRENFYNLTPHLGKAIKRGNVISYDSKGKTRESPGKEVGHQGTPLTPLSSPLYSFRGVSTL